MPKKKGRHPSRAASTPSGDVAEHPAEETQTPMKNELAKTAIVPDLWTDEQETSLFKGMIRWKPVGMHKHFRMIAISQHLRNHGYTSPRDDHTRIPYIWEKLRNLYNLEALDERENFLGDVGLDEGQDHTREPFCEFSLPDDEYGEMMFAKRLAPEGSLSPPSLPSVESDIGTRRQSTIDDTDDPHSSPASAIGQRSTRGRRGARRSQLQEVSIPLAQSENSKASADDGMEGGRKETEQNDDEAEENEQGKEASRNGSKAANSKAKKRRSGRRSSGMLHAFAKRRSAFRTTALKSYHPKALAMSSVNVQKESSSVLPEGKPTLVDINIFGDRLIDASGYREDKSKGQTLRFEASLPRLPVPTLEETARRYLKSVRPLLSKSEFATTEKVVEDFIKPGSIGQELQKRLHARRDDPKCINWIYRWWNETAYLSYRDPVVPYVSYFYSHRDDKRRRNPAKRAAALTRTVCKFKDQLDHNELEPEYMKGLPLSMESYQWMFNACRMPGKHVDHPIKYSHTTHQYFIVVRKNRFFKVLHSFNNQQLNASELEKQFQLIYERAEKAPAVGALTSENRDVWAVARASLCSAHPSNAATLETIQASSFVVCLDDASPVTLEERAHQYWHGDGSNRWFDKPLQFIINDNGTSGFMGEHSMMDGTPTHRLNDYVNMQIFTDKIDLTDQNIRSDLPEPVALNFHINQDVDQAIDRALASFKSLISQHELKVQAFHGYGKGLIKKFQCSPDAFVQMIIQLAYSKMYGINRPTYESAATRRFQQGRTETCRSLSEESVEFCRAMANPQVSSERRQKAFRAAIDAHVRYITDASDGKGVDRHLFGLRKCLQQGEALPELYKDPAYGYSGKWFLSTSQLSSEYFNGYGWSQVIDEGFGIAYMINENSMQFNIVSKGLGCEKMSYWLAEAACEIRDLLFPVIRERAKL